MSTIWDVASYAHVSKSTVSLVLNNSPLVKEATRNTVLQAIQTLGYIPRGNIQRTNNLGVLSLIEGETPSSYGFDQFSGTFIEDITSGIRSALAESGYGIVTEMFSAFSGTLPHILQKKSIDGLFIIGTLTDHMVIDFLKASSLPTVIIGRSDDSFPSVFTDFFTVTELATHALLEKGCTKLLLLNAPQTFPSNEARTWGFKHALESHPDVASLVVYSLHNHGKGAYDALCALDAFPYDGIVCANDMLALGAIRFLKERGLAFPSDVRVVSGEDSFFCSYNTPPIPAVDLNKRKMGSVAAVMMVKLLKRPHAFVSPEVVPVSFVDR